MLFLGIELFFFKFLIVVVFLNVKTLLRIKRQERRKQYQNWKDSAFDAAIFASNVRAMRELVQMGANVKWTDKMGYNYIHWALLCGHYKIIKYLVESGVDIEHQSRFRLYKPIHMCGFVPDEDKCLEELLKCGAQRYALDYRGNTLLHVVVKYTPRNLRFIQKLLDYGFDPNATSASGGTNCLHIIADSERCPPKIALSLARMFIKKGVDINGVTTPQHETPLRMACRSGKTSLVDLLLREGAIDIECRIRYTGFKEVYCNGNNPRMDIIVIFIKHLALKKRRGENIDENFSWYITHKEVNLQRIYRKYEEELNRLQSIKIVESHRVTLHDILCGKTSEVVKYLSSASVRDNVSKLKVSTFFSREIQHRFRKIMEIVEFQEESCRLVYEFSHRTLPYSCLREITKYLSERDVKELSAFLRNDNRNRKMS